MKEVQTKDDFKVVINPLIKRDSLSLSFLSLSLILKEKDPEEMKKKAKEIIDLVKEKYPEVGLEFYNFRDDTYTVERIESLCSYPQVAHVPHDKECIVETIQEMQTNSLHYLKEGKLERKYFACVYALLIFGWLGEYTEKMTQKDFCTWLEQRGFNTLRHSQFSTILSNLRYSNIFPNYNSEVEVAVKFTKFQVDFIKLYWMKMMRKYGSFEEMKNKKPEL